MGEPLRELTLGTSVKATSKPQDDLMATSHSRAAAEELAAVAARCRSKAEAAHWAVERLLRMREGNGCRGPGREPA